MHAGRGPRAPGFFGLEQRSSGAAQSPSDLLELHAREARTLQSLLDIAGDDERPGPSLRTEHLGVAHLRRVDAHVAHGGVLPDFVRQPILVRPEPYPGSLLVDT